MSGHDLSENDSSFECTAYTYDDLVRDELRFARAAFKALEWVDEFIP
jgi:hypothetical protein